MKEKITDKPLSVIEKAIGIDTVNIKIEKYKFINPENTKLMICHAPTDKDNIPLYNNVLWHDENQKPVMGSKATYNSEKYNFNLTLTARRNNEKPRIEISFETAKIFTGNNYKTKNVKELMEALNLIKSEVKEKCGISFNLEDVMLSKLHIQMTIEFKGSIAIMFDALKYVDVILSMIIFYSHSQSLRWDSKSNSYKKLNIYNKNIKMNETHHSSWEGLTEGYIDAMRIEYKLESKKAISEDLKIKYVTELTQDKINKIFIKILKEVISLAMPKSCYSVNGTIKDKYKKKTMGLMKLKSLLNYLENQIETIAEQ